MIQKKIIKQKKDSILKKNFKNKEAQLINYLNVKIRKRKKPYKILYQINRGAFGILYKAICTVTKTVVAIKKINYYD